MIPPENLWVWHFVLVWIALLALFVILEVAA